MISADIGGALLVLFHRVFIPTPSTLFANTFRMPSTLVHEGSLSSLLETPSSYMTMASGMIYPELVQACQSGISRKDYVQQVGFRGIGVYSGFDCATAL